MEGKRLQQVQPDLCYEVYMWYSYSFNLNIPFIYYVYLYFWYTSELVYLIMKKQQYGNLGFNGYEYLAFIQFAIGRQISGRKESWKEK